MSATVNDVTKEILLQKPEPGEDHVQDVLVGYDLLLDFSMTDVEVIQNEDDLIIIFENESQITLANIVTVIQDNPDMFGVDISGMFAMIDLLNKAIDISALADSLDGVETASGKETIDFQVTSQRAEVDDEVINFSSNIQASGRLGSSDDEEVDVIPSIEIRNGQQNIASLGDGEVSTLEAGIAELEITDDLETVVDEITTNAAKEIVGQSTDTVVSVEVTRGDPATSTSYQDETLYTADTESNLDTISVVRTYTDVTEVSVTETTSSQDVVTLTFDDGSTEVVYREPVVNEVVTVETTSSERQDIISETTEEPEIETNYQVVTSTVQGDTSTSTTSEQSTVRTIDNTNNVELDTTTTEYTDTSTTPITTTVTTTPVYTITYADGTVETENGTPLIEETVVNEVSVSTRSETSVVTIEPTSETETVTTVETTRGTPVTTSTHEDTVTRQNDTENNEEIVTVTREYTDTTNTDVTETTTVQDVTTLTFSDGTQKLIYGNPTTSVSETVESTTATRSSIISQSVEEPTITTAYETVTETNSGSETLTTESSVTVERVIDKDNNSELETTTTTYTDTYSTPVVETVTTTPVYTITYSDGTVETETGTALTEVTNSTSTRVEVRTETASETFLPTMVETSVVTVETNTGVANTETTFSDSTTTTTDVNTNQETVTVTREFTDTTTTPVETVTTTTPQYTYTYSDGSTEVELGTPVSTSNTVDTVTVTVRQEVISESSEAPEITVTYEETVSVSYGDEVVSSTSYTDSTSRTIDYANDEEVIQVVRETTTNYETPVFTTTTSTPTYTLTYSDGTVETEVGTAVDTVVETSQSRVSVSDSVISTTTEEPTFTYSDEVETTVVRGEASTSTSSSDQSATTSNNNGTETTVITRTTTDVTTTPIETTTITTTTTTLTYSDGSTETVIGDPVSVVTNSSEVSTSTSSTVISSDTTPLTTPVTFAATEDIAIVITESQLLQNAYDADNDDLTTSDVTVDGGRLDPIAGTNNFQFTPDANFNGDVNITYKVSDGTTTIDATGTIQVAAVNDGPIAGADSFTTNEDTSVSFSVDQLLANDSDIEGDDLSVIFVSTPENGSLEMNDDGSYTFTPGQNFSGNDSLTYIVSDGTNQTTGNVNLTVAAQVDGVAIDSSISFSDAQYSGGSGSGSGSGKGSGSGSGKGSGSGSGKGSGKGSGSGSGKGSGKGSGSGSGKGSANEDAVAVDDFVTHKIAISLQQDDTGETIESLTISEVPDNGSFDKGTDNGDGSWSFSENDLTDLSFTQTGNIFEDVDMTFTVVSNDGDQSVTQTAPLNIESLISDASFEASSSDSSYTNVDVYYGDDTDNTVIGGGGSNAIYGGAGDDYLSGGKGKDELFGGEGQDTLYGGKNNDTLTGGTSDTLDGGSGNDSILLTNSDSLDGPVGQIDGGSGNDTLQLGDLVQDDWSLKIGDQTFDSSSDKSEVNDAIDDASGSFTISISDLDMKVENVESVDW